MTTQELQSDQKPPIPPLPPHKWWQWIIVYPTIITILVGAIDNFVPMIQASWATKRFVGNSEEATGIIQ
ncbi:MULTISPECIES: hypothetical protein [Nostoc]|uniref:MFS transporter n=2 Tax=Nostoc TaxID=1177 RepID=A0ABR8IIM9_9NOSO|nr:MULTISPECIES: hypothetical protein [Nostoc]MBD2564352.1 hypothetical protein [Nostoc linckia FACHB-391]MBD2650140.1 hypothetical protein [Nostoc foliaceum FACHB-393]